MIHRLNPQSTSLIKAANPLFNSSFAGSELKAFSGDIPTEQARRLFTNSILQAVVDARNAPMRGMLTFFTQIVRESLLVSRSIRREYKFAAPYAVRGDQATVIQNSKSNTKAYKPFYSNLALNLGEYDVYNTFFGQQRSTVQEGDVENVLDEMRSDIMSLKNMILRLPLVQLATFLETGIITGADGEEIPFGRSETAVADTVKGITQVQPTNKFTIAGQTQNMLGLGTEFIKKQGGGAQAGVLYAFPGSEVWTAIQNDSTFSAELKTTQNQFRLEQRPQMTEAGLVKLGEMTLNEYYVEFWSWPDFYYAFEDAGTTNPTPINYINSKNCYLLASDFTGDELWGGVPRLPVTESATTLAILSSIQTDNPGIVPFYAGEPMSGSQFWGLRAAPAVLPANVDKIVSYIGAV